MLKHMNVNFTNLNQSAFASEKVSTSNQSLSALQKEEKENLQSLDLSLNSKGVKVLFEDEKSEQLISLNISEENYLRLRNEFSTLNDFHLRNDGQIRLNGEAQNFVSSWFSHFAHGLNWLGADKNINASVEGNELKDAYVDKILTPNIGANKVSFQSITTRAFGNVSGSLSLEQGLDYALTNDKDLDGKFSFGEFYDKGSLRDFGSIAQDQAKPKDNDEKIKEKTQEELLEEAKEKGLASLSPQELESLKQKYPTEFEKLEEKSKELEGLKQSLGKDFELSFASGEIRILDLRA